MPLDANTIARVATPEPAVGDLGCGRYWAVIHTHPQAERWACSQLNRSGYTTFLPLYAARTHDRATPTITRWVQRPLFTSYAFVSINADQWVPIRYTPGVHQLLMSNGKPQHANSEAVERLQALEPSRGEIYRPDAAWRPGAAVAPACGPFAGLPGVVLATNGDEATVGILFLGQLREVVYPFDAIISRNDF